MRIKELARQTIDGMVQEWFERNTARWWTVVEVANSLGLNISATHSALRRLSSGQAIERDELRKEKNGSRHPIYRLMFSGISEEAPAWMTPQPPEFPAHRIAGIRVRIA